MTAKDAVRQVLREAADTPNFFDLSDSERLVRMLGMAFEKGKEVRRDGKRGRRKNRSLAKPRV